MVTAIMIALILCRYSFLIIPGLQLELVAAGQTDERPASAPDRGKLSRSGRWLSRGGWFFLSNSYGLGGDTIREQAPYRQQRWYLHPLYDRIERSDGEHAGGATCRGRERGGRAPFRVDDAIPPVPIGTAVTVVLRQTVCWLLVPPHWVCARVDIHPPVCLGGSVLAAWAIRLLVLKMGGAATVRKQVAPVLCGRVSRNPIAAYAIFFFVNGYMFSFYPSVQVEGVAF